MTSQLYQLQLINRPQQLINLSIHSGKLIMSYYYHNYYGLLTAAA